MEKRYDTQSMTPEEIKTVSNQQRKRNELLYILRHISQTTSTHLTAGAFASAFMLYIGLNTEMISVVNFSMNMGLFAASVLVIFAYNWDKSGLGIVRLGSLGNILTPGCMLLASFLYLRSLNSAYLCLVVCCFIANTAYSMRNSAEINAVPMLFGRERYATVMGKCGYLGGLVTLIVSCTTIFLLRANKDIGYYRTFFAISTVLMIAYFVLAMLFRRPLDKQNTKQVQVDIKLMFTKKYLLASLPHLTRGVGAAAWTLWPATIMSHLEMTPLLSSLLIPMAIVAEIIGSFVYMRLSKRLKPGFMTMISFIVSAIFMFLTPVITTVPLFLVSYFVYSLMMSGFGKALIQCFVYSCEKEELALISSLHVLYYAVTFCPAVLIFGKLMDGHTMLCMGTAGVIYIISGVLFHLFYRVSVEEKRKLAQK